MQIAVVMGTTPFYDPATAADYAGLARQCGAGQPIRLANGGFERIGTLCGSLEETLNARLGRPSGRGDPDEDPAVLVGHSASPALLAAYLLKHPRDRAVFIAGNLRGVDYLPHTPTALEAFVWPIRQMADTWLPVLRDFGPGSPFLTEISSRAPEYCGRVTVVASMYDRTVAWPASLVDGARTILIGASEEERPAYGRHDPLVSYQLLGRIGHQDIVRDERVRALVAEEILAMSAPRSQRHLRLLPPAS